MDTTSHPGNSLVFHDANRQQHLYFLDMKQRLPIAHEKTQNAKYQGILWCQIHKINVTPATKLKAATFSLISFLR